MVTFEALGGIIGGILFFMLLAGYVSWRAMRNNAARYPPRVARPGRPGQTRTKGLALGVLDSIPIVEFGNRAKSSDAAPKDIEMGDRESTSKVDSTIVSEAAATKKSSATEGIEAVLDTNHSSNLAATTVFQENQCAICISDFVANEEVRVLPCDHRYHPACIDPWLLNVSGTCPICRYDLRPNDPNNPNNVEVIIPPDEDYLPVTSPIGYIRDEALRQEAARMEAYASFQSSAATVTVPPPTLASPRERMSIRSRLREIRQSLNTGPEYVAALSRFYRDSEGRNPTTESQRVR
ncbi:hypothetical protein DL98DRAFT_639239 [Cadophora sp. DSE1049]|nr:hypothetical protein DL98DRAFT_639239 [Cadophora sp. DSE1049]